MDFLKDFFDGVEDGKLSYEELKQAVEAEGMKLVNLSEGKYVSKEKYTDDLEAKSKEIKTLNDTLKTRDTDLAELQTKLEEAGTDADKLNTLSNDFSALKTKYDDDVKAYKNQLKAQAYDFAIREHVNDLKFSSEAAKRDYINQIKAKELKMEGNSIIGISDFDAVYTQNNADAFVIESPDPEPSPVKPQFISPTAGDTTPTDPTGGFASAFHFTPIHPVPEN